MRCVVVCCLVTLAACYDPNVECLGEHCAQVIPDSPTQIASTIDAAPGDASNTEPPPPPGDAAAPPPPPPADAPAPKPCAPGCSGTCDDGVCVISCVGTEACEEEVVCPLSGPCRVVCNGRKACKKGVRCGLGRCTVTCNGDDACDKQVRCDVACACDVSCGPDACKDEAVCSKPWCEAGDGCTSVPNSCNSC